MKTSQMKNIALSLALILSIAGCGDNQFSASDSANTATEAAAESSVTVAIFNGQWADSYGDPWIVIHVSGDGVDIAAQDNDDGWYSEFTDVSFRDGVLKFTRSDYLQSGEDDEYSGIPVSFELQVNSTDANKANVVVKMEDSDGETFEAIRTSG